MIILILIIKTVEKTAIISSVWKENAQTNKLCITLTFYCIFRRHFYDKNMFQICELRFEENRKEFSVQY